MHIYCVLKVPSGHTHMCSEEYSYILCSLLFLVYFDDDVFQRSCPSKVREDEFRYIISTFSCILVYSKNTRKKMYSSSSCTILVIRRVKTWNWNESHPWLRWMSEEDGEDLPLIRVFIRLSPPKIRSNSIKWFPETLLPRTQSNTFLYPIGLHWNILVSD